VYAQDITMIIPGMVIESGGQVLIGTAINPITNGMSVPHRPIHMHMHA
jgi:hypothetical protein